MLNNSTKLILLFAALGITACLLVFVWLNFQHRNNNQNLNDQPKDTLAMSPSEEVSTTPSQTKSLTERYVSESLGIAFNYSPNNTDVPTEDIGRIFVGGENGQWVQVFPKDPKQSITDTIQKNFLLEADPETCYVKEASYIKAPDVSVYTISYPLNADEAGPWWSNAEKCGNYATTNGISYFYYNSLFPDRFYYFSIGQYAILSGLTDTLTGNPLPWQQTFSILK